MTTNRALSAGAALLGAALLAPLALAQDAGDAPPAANDVRTLRHVDPDDDATTTLTARPQGDAWRVELTRARAPGSGPASEQRMQLVIPRSAEVDRELEALFEERPDDPATWGRRLEAATGVDIAFDLEGGPGQERLRELSERMREEMRQAFEAARDELRELLDRGGEPDGATPAARDQVWLEGGERASGELLSVDATTVRLRTASGEVEELPRDEVRRIDLGRPVRPMLGVAIVDAPGGVRVEGVKAGSPAARAGLRPGDVIVSFADEAVRDGAHLRQLVAARAPNDTVSLTVRRGEEERELSVSLTPATSVPAAKPRDDRAGPY